MRNTLGKSSTQTESSSDDQIPGRNLRSPLTQIGALSDVNPARRRFKELIISAVNLPKPAAWEIKQESLSSYVLVSNAVMSYP